MPVKNSKKCCLDTPIRKQTKLSNKNEKRQFMAMLAKALAHPVRIQILEILKSKNTCICGELVDELPVAQATVSQHLKVLKNAGLIRGTISGPATCYCIDTAVLTKFKSLLKNF